MAKPVRRKRFSVLQAGKIDNIFLSLVLIILTIGLVMLFSASYAFSYAQYGNSYKFIMRQGAFGVIGVGVMLAVSKIDYHIWRKFAWIIYGISMLMLVILLILPPMLKGKDVKRWFVIGPINFQPSEIAKFAVILLFSSLIAANYKQMKRIGFLAFLIGILGLTCVLTFPQPFLFFQ